jgi:hypothetical protein
MPRIDGNGQPSSGGDDPGGERDHPSAHEASALGPLVAGPCGWDLLLAPQEEPARRSQMNTTTTPTRTARAPHDWVLDGAPDDRAVWPA